MKLVIVASKGLQREVGRVYTDSSLADILVFLGLLGINEWELDMKGDVRLYFNGPELYVAVGPSSSLESKEFLKQAKDVTKKIGAPLKNTLNHDATE